jgi:hypothetical protein
MFALRFGDYPGSAGKHAHGESRSLELVLEEASDVGIVLDYEDRALHRVIVAGGEAAFSAVSARHSILIIL